MIEQRHIAKPAFQGLQLNRRTLAESLGALRAEINAAEPTDERQIGMRFAGNWVIDHLAETWLLEPEHLNRGERQAKARLRLRSARGGRS